MIKRPLLAGMTGENRLRLGNIVVVTSALPGEGKTFTTINLALSLALERDREVVLVDGDVAKAHMTHVFGLDGEPGLLDLGAAGCESRRDHRQDRLPLAVRAPGRQQERRSHGDSAVGAHRVVARVPGVRSAANRVDRFAAVARDQRSGCRDLAGGSGGGGRQGCRDAAGSGDACASRPSRRTNR